MKLPPQQIENRAILRQAMEQAGFKGIRTEWWHFDGAARSAYPIAPEEVARPLLLE
jgi:D-alanyl-D-alanine dipeptidase